MDHRVLIADTERSLGDAIVADFSPQLTPPLLLPVQSPSLPQRPPQPAPSAVRRLALDNQSAAIVAVVEPGLVYSEE